MAELPRTACFDCGRTHPPERKRCDCGQPVWFDVEPAAGDVAATGRDRGSGPGIWRHAAALPVSAPEDPRADLGAATGATPLFRAPGLASSAGADGDRPEVWIKDETANPTGTFKDRGTAVAVHGIGQRRGAEAPSANARVRIGTVSHGNMAISTAAFGAATGTGAVVLVPEDVPAERLAAIARYDPAVYRVAGDYGRLYRETLALSPAETGIDFVNSDTPLRVAGQKTVAHEVCAGLGRDGTDGAAGFAAPDAVVLPVSSGGHASAVWKGLRELRSAELIDDLPRIYPVQAAACAPIAGAFAAGRGVRPVDPGETAAYSIANPDPPSGDRALAAARDTGGAVFAVDEAAIGRAVDAVARRAGLCVEPGSAVALAGLRELVEGPADAGVAPVESDETVVLVATGTGFRDLRAGGVDAPVVDLAGLDDRLRDDVGDG